MPLTTPPKSVHTQMVLDLVDFVQADTDLLSYFAWEEIPSGKSDWPNRRRVILDDNASVPPQMSPKLVITHFAANQRGVTLDDMGGDSRVITQVKVVTYVHVPQASNGEDEKILVSDLATAVLNVIANQEVGPEKTGEGPAWDACYIVSDIEWDQTDRFRRAGFLVHLELYKNTR